MARITFVLENGAESTVEHRGQTQTLMELARQNAIPGVSGDCGGAMACATCHIHVDPAWCDHVGQAGEDEREIIELTAEPARESRLGCQVWITDQLDGLRVRIAAH